MDHRAKRHGECQLFELVRVDMEKRLLNVRRLAPDAGIAIGAILFALALIAVVSIAMSAGGGNIGNVISIDRVTADIKSQGLMITNKIRECYTNGYANKQLDCSNNTFDALSGTWTRPGCSPIDTDALYPASTGSGTAIESVTCPSYGVGLQNLWSGQSPAMLPPPTNGFDKWYYVNAGSTGGRCIRIQPQPATVNDSGMRNGLIEAANSFSASELTFVSGSISQRFILWITRPSGAASADCSP
jgi:hypothetical protein